MVVTLSTMPVCFGVEVDGHMSPCLYLHKSNEGLFLKRVLWVLNISLAVSWMLARKGKLGQFVRSSM